MARKDFTYRSLFTERRYFALVMVLLFLILSTATFFILQRHHAIHTAHVLKEDRENAKLLALILEQRLQRIVAVMESYSQRSSLLKAVRERNAEEARVHLRSLMAGDPDIDILVITDKKGTLWAAEPARPEVMGMNLAHREWYHGVSREWKTDISDVIKRIVRERDLAIQISVPLIDEKGEVIGILVNTERTVGLNRIVGQVSLDPGASLSIVDGKGQIIYSGRYAYEKKISVYPFYADMNKATAAGRHSFSVVDPDLGGQMRYISLSPVGKSGWTVFCGRDKQSILLSELPYFSQVAATVLFLFLTIVMLLLYLRKQTTIEQIRRQLEAERIISDGKEKLRDLALHQQTLLAAIPDIIMEVDANKVYTWANPAGLDFFGEDVIGKDAAFYFAGEQETYGAVQPLFNGGRESVYIESLQRRRDGQIRLLAWWCQAFADKDGQITGALSSARDITDQRQAQEDILTLNAELERRVRERTAQLEAANRELEAFSYSVSHDLRAPLRSIDGFSQALLEDYPDRPLDDAGKKYLERVRMASQRMGLLIDDMLKLSRITKAEMKWEPVDLSGLVREIVRAQQKGAGRAVEVVIQDGVVIKGDRSLLKVAIENLMDNAFKFTGRKADPRIEFGAVVRDGRTTCFIRDNGAGFEMAYAGKLFGAFQRLHTTEEFPGTGIGLATVQRIIHRHGGEVRAEGEVGRGATFYFSIA